MQRLTRGLPRLGDDAQGTDLPTAVLLSLLFSPLLMGTLGCFLCSALPSGFWVSAVLGYFDVLYKTAKSLRGTRYFNDGMITGEFLRLLPCG